MLFTFPVSGFNLVADQCVKKTNQSDYIRLLLFSNKNIDIKSQYHSGSVVCPPVGSISWDVMCVKL